MPLHACNTAVPERTDLPACEEGSKGDQPVAGDQRPTHATLALYRVWGASLEAQYEDPVSTTQQSTQQSTQYALTHSRIHALTHSRTHGQTTALSLLHVNLCPETPCLKPYLNLYQMLYLRLLPEAAEPIGI